MENIKDALLFLMIVFNPLFENEFFDSIFSSGEYDPSCSSGRLSRTYFFFETHSNLSESYTYFEDKTIGGLAPADYCPVAQGIHGSEGHIQPGRLQGPGI